MILYKYTIMFKTSKIKPQPINLDSIEALWEPLPKQILGKRKLEDVPLNNNLKKLRFS
jgi:hypothetical protein